MRKTRRNLGFTMAELLIVVAIIVILSSVSFIAVQRHRRSLAQLERNTIAKEIFVAAQNHLTMAESEGYLAKNLPESYFGVTESGAGDKNPKVVRHIVSGGTSDNILDLMLPFGSIDETVRTGGSYLIRYQTNPAQILDVFYCSTSGSPSSYNHTISESDYSTFYPAYRGEGKQPTTGYVVGWYGGTEELSAGSFLEAPSIVVENAERLTVRITDPNKTDSTKAALSPLLKLIITAVRPGVDEADLPQASILLSNASAFSEGSRYWYSSSDDRYTVVLDDVTTAYNGGKGDGLHFADLNTTTDTSIALKKDASNNIIPFRPGENITIQAVAYSNSALTNIAYSAERTTNSLFADPGEDAATAMVENFRHLENLDAAVSGLDASLNFTKAEQIADLVWNDPDDASDFVSKITTAKGTDSVKVYKLNDTTGTAANSYLPVTPSTATADGDPTPIPLAYEGNHHKVTSVTVDAGATAGGLFGEFGVSGTGNVNSVSNLELIDFTVNLTSGNAGALAGKTTNTDVTNVLVRHLPDSTGKTITATTGNAGGLIGNVSGGTVTNCAAAAVVSGGNAGGLIGVASGGTVTGCYSGGHTDNGVYTDAIGFDVTATGNAGGLIGTAGSGMTIQYSYSTCSVTGAAAGGFLGQLMGPGSSATDCYCVGRVEGTTEGAFAGTLSTGAGPANFTGCKYFEIVNPRLDDADHPYLPALGSSLNDTTVARIDESAATYNEFVGAPENWKAAAVYDKNSARIYYMNDDDEDNGLVRYGFKTVAQLGATVNENETTTGGVTTPPDLVATHCGDWPTPETYVENTAGS